MPNLNPNSTSYVHSSEPNTNDLTMAMDYDVNGKPAIRVLSNIQGDITIEGDVTIPGIVTVTNTDDDPLFTHTHLYDENEAEYTAANPFTIDGTVNLGTVPEIEVKNDVGNPLNINILEGGVAVDGDNALPTRRLNDEGLIAYARGGAVTETDVLSAFLIDRSGSTDNVGNTPATMSTVWEGGGLYPWTTFSGTGAHLFVASTANDAKMQGVEITIEGLDSNYDVITETVTLNATDTTTAQETTQNFYRINQAYVSGNNTNSLPHDENITVKYGSASGTTVSIIQAPFGNTQSCIYTVPRGFQAFMLGVNGSSGDQDEITSMVWNRPFDGAWRQIKTFKFVSGTFEHNMRTPLVFDEKSDIEMRAQALIESSRIGTEFQLLVIPKVS